MNFFEEASLRLKQELKVRSDKAVATALGLSAVAWVGRKNRNNFPEVELRALAQQRPDLDIDIEYVLTGKSSRHPAAHEAQDAFISRQQAINRHIALINAMPLDATVRMRMSVLMTGDPLKDGPVIAQAFSGGLLSSDEEELVGLFRAAPLTAKAAAIGVLQGGAKTKPATQAGGVNQTISAPVQGSVAGRDVFHNSPPAKPPRRPR